MIREALMELRKKWWKADRGGATAAVIIDKEADGGPVMYMTRLRKTGSWTAPKVLYVSLHGLYRRNSAESSEKVYIDQWDLLAQRKDFIPLRRIQRGSQVAWLQADKSLEGVHYLFEDIAGL